MTPAISIRNLTKSFGAHRVLLGVDLDIYRGKTTSILGLSGTGKSTIIRHIIGLLTADSGTINVCGDLVDTSNEPLMQRIRRKIGFLFQSGALFDYMSVYQNIEFPLLELTTDTPAQRQKKICRCLDLVGLNSKEVKDLMPHELSGGMKKRVGLARTIVLDPEIILYDEPTSGLDPITSDKISRLILSLQEKMAVTSVLISHDMQEVFKCSDFIAMLYEGKIIEFKSAADFKNTRNPVCAQFITGNSSGEIVFD